MSPISEFRHTVASTGLSVRLEIRRLRSSDYMTVMRIEEFILDEYRQYLKRTRERDEVPSGIQPAYFDYYVRTKSSFAALVDGEVVGYILSQPVSFTDGEKKILWLDYVAVLPEFRRRGIGSSLLSKGGELGDAARLQHALHRSEPQQHSLPSPPRSKGLRGEELDESCEGTIEPGLTLKGTALDVHSQGTNSLEFRSAQKVNGTGTSGHESTASVLPCSPIRP